MLAEPPDSRVITVQPGDISQGLSALANATQYVQALETVASVLAALLCPWSVPFQVGFNATSSDTTIARGDNWITRSSSAICSNWQVLYVR